MTTADELLGPAAALEGEELTLPSGLTVRVRGLSRKDVLAAREADEGMIAFESVVIAHGLVEPRLTVEQVDELQSRPGRAGDVKAIADRIYELSGLGEGAGKSAVPGDGERPID